MFRTVAMIGLIPALTGGLLLAAQENGSQPAQQGEQTAREQRIEQLERKIDRLERRLQQRQSGCMQSSGGQKPGSTTPGPMVGPRMGMGPMMGQMQPPGMRMMQQGEMRPMMMCPMMQMTGGMPKQGGDKEMD